MIIKHDQLVTRLAVVGVTHENCGNVLVNIILLKDVLKFNLNLKLLMFCGLNVD